MTLTDYIVDLALIAVVIRQMRTRELSLRSMILPIWLVAIAAFSYLRPVPVSAHNVVLVGILVAAGVALGVLSGMATRVWRTSDGALFARAGLLAAFFWVAGMTARFAFAVYATHWGQGAVTQFSIEHGITGAHMWPVALVLMALGEVLARVAVLQLRRLHASGTSPTVQSTPSPSRRSRRCCREGSCPLAPETVEFAQEVSRGHL